MTQMSVQQWRKCDRPDAKQIMTINIDGAFRRVIYWKLRHGYDIATRGYHRIKPVLLRIMQRCIQATQRPHVREWPVFDPIHARPSAATDNQFFDLIAQAIGDMFDQRGSIQGCSCLVAPKARSLAAGNDRAQPFQRKSSGNSLMALITG